MQTPSKINLNGHYIYPTPHSLILQYGVLILTNKNYSIDVSFDGIYIKYNGNQLFFKTAFEIDPVELSKKISIDPKEALELKLKLEDMQIKAPLTIDKLKSILGTTVKRDDTNKVIVFLCGLSAYTEDSQFNISFRGPSASGKSYIPLEIAQYFPEEDVVMIAYSSPTAFFHDAGEWLDEDKCIHIDLERKILIFLDQPHDQLLQRLRPLLSHDRKRLLYKITDKSERKGLRTKNVIINGFPAVIFSTGSFKIDEQELTRNIILSPEISQEKIREAIFIKAMRKANPELWDKYLKEHPERELLKKRIEKIKEENVKHVIVRDYEKVVKRFLEKCSKLKPRHSRDIERLISLIQSITLLNVWHRERDEHGNVYANDEDIDEAFKLYDEIWECQELGIPPYIYDIYNEVIKPLYIELNKNSEIPIGIERKEILKRYSEVYGRNLSEATLRLEILPTLERAGLIYQEPSPNDRRKMLVYCNLRIREQESGVAGRQKEKSAITPHSDSRIPTGNKQEEKTKIEQKVQAQDEGKSEDKDQETSIKQIFICKCGCGPWLDISFAKEHLMLCKNKEGHEIKSLEIKN
jgi:hypothetical protein